jgi:hypothetical protein
MASNAVSPTAVLLRLVELCDVSADVPTAILVGSASGNVRTVFAFNWYEPLPRLRSPLESVTMDESPEIVVPVEA